jgi:hypothetical protein
LLLTWLVQQKDSLFSVCNTTQFLAVHLAVLQVSVKKICTLLYNKDI